MAQINAYNPENGGISNLPQSGAIGEFSHVEVAPCRTFRQPDGSTFTEQVDRDDAEFWSVFGRYVEGGAEAFSDHPTETLALAEARRVAALFGLQHGAGVPS